MLSFDPSKIPVAGSVLRNEMLALSDLNQVQLQGLVFEQGRIILRVVDAYETRDLTKIDAALRDLKAQALLKGIDEFLREHPSS
jgi:hypothetical protein